MEKNLFGTHPVSLVATESCGPPPAFASDPLIAVPSLGGMGNNASSPLVAQDEINVIAGYSAAAGVRSSKVPDILEVHGPSTVGNFMKGSSPTGMEKNLFGTHPVSLAATESRGPPPAFASDPLIAVPSLGGMGKNASSPLVAQDEINVIAGYSAAAGVGSSKVPDILEVHGPSTVGNFMKGSSPTGMEKNLFGTHPVSLAATESHGPLPAFASDPLVAVSSPGGMGNNASSPLVAQDEINVIAGYLAAAGAGSSKVPDILEVHGPSTAGNFMKGSSPQNPSRRLLKEERKQMADYLFKAAGEGENGTSKPPPPPSGDFAIGQGQLASIVRDHNVSALQQYEGVQGLSYLLNTNLEKGIQGDDADLLKRRNAFGSNTYPRKKRRSFLMFLWEAWRQPILIILTVAAAIILALDLKTQGFANGLYGGGGIAIVVILIVVLRAITNYIKYIQFRSLNEEKRNIHVEVIRGGRRFEISAYDIVVGDVVPLNIGNQVPADGVLISGHSFGIDESSMTGESMLVDKDSRDPFLMSGCKVADGSGTMLVTSVGLNTEWGLLMVSTSEETCEETPLQKRLNGAAALAGKLGLSVAVGLLIILFIRYFTGRSKNPDGSTKFVRGVTDAGRLIPSATNFVAVAVAIAVGALPDGLPLALTLNLAYSMRKMMADKALVRRLSACETVGTTTTICCDKTGTLTLNQMTVVEAYVGEKTIDARENKSELSPILSSLLIEGIAQNTNGSVNAPEGGRDVEVYGSPTEKAILHWGLKLGMNFEAIRSESSVIHLFPLNSEKKRGGVALQLPDSQVHIHWKGAAEIVLALCTRYLDATDQLVAMDEDKERIFKKAIEDMAAGGLRCIAIAYRTYIMENVPSSESELAQWAIPEDDLVLLAIVGIKDPCRPGVKDAVQLCQCAGVKVRMITGDNVQTAKTIALECGILSSDCDITEPILIDGSTFRALSDLQREEIVDRISVMARSSPNDKLLLVKALKRRGHVVAVASDGANDALALREADIGLAMGLSGTEVAKESSDIIILDDSFASVVKVVMWGRSVYANIGKINQFQRTSTVATIIILIILITSTSGSPLNPLQLFWIYLVMRIIGTLALATEPATDQLMHRPPRGCREPLTTNDIRRNVLIQAVYQVSVLLVLKIHGKSLLNLEHDRTENSDQKHTMIFNVFILCQIFDAFNARKPDEFNVFKGITKNYYFMVIVGVTVVLQVVIINFLGKYASTVRLTWSQWRISVVVAFISWPLAVLGKLIPVPRTHFCTLIIRRLFKRTRTSCSLGCPVDDVMEQALEEVLF